MRLIKYLLKVLPSKPVYAHCDIPCGIYDPYPAQIAAHTILRMTQMLKDLGKDDHEKEDEHAEDWIKMKHDVSRMTHVKEEHGQNLEHELDTLLNDYFKPEHFEKFPELMDKIRKQAEKFGTRFISEDVTSVDFSKKPFKIQTETQNLEAEAVIIATGASAMWLGLESEQKFIGKGVSACAVCDGFFFRDKNIIVVGGGDTAMREAQHLSKYGKKVTVVHRRDTFRAQTALIELVKSKPNVEFLFNRTIDEVLGEDKVTAVNLKDTKTGEVTKMEVDGVFIAIGHKPNTDFLGKEIELDEKGYISVHDDTHTSVEGVFFAGDVADKKYKQAATAAGMGVKAALDVEEYLEKLKLPTEN